MIAECQNCNSKFDVKDNLIPLQGRVVQCGSCQFKWHQLPSITKIPLKKKIIDKVDIHKDETKVHSISKKKIKKLEKIKNNVQHKKQTIGFFSYIFLFLISIIALFLILETFKNQIINIFPNFENYIIYVYETLNNILIPIKDLFKSY